MSAEVQYIRIEQFRVDERYWPKGASELVRRWLAEDYDPVTMPPLAVVPQEDGTFNVVGWEGGEEPLFHAVFGRDPTDEEIVRAQQFSARDQGDGRKDDHRRRAPVAE